MTARSGIARAGVVLALGVPMAGGCGGKTRTPQDRGAGELPCVDLEFALGAGFDPPTRKVVLALDASEGMATAASGTASVWDATRGALDELFADLDLATALGLVVFSGAPVTGEMPECARLLTAPELSSPEQRAALASGLAGWTPAGPRASARGVELAREIADSAPFDVRSSIVLLSGGATEPGSACSDAGDPQSALVAAAREAYESGTPVFVIGLPGSESAREALAEVADGGGTCLTPDELDCHADLTSEPDLGGALRRVFEQYVTKPLATVGTCEIPLPAGPAGSTIDPRTGSISIAVDGNPTQALQLESGCVNGVHVSEGNLVFCGDACTAVSNAEFGTLRLQFGCLDD